VQERFALKTSGTRRLQQVPASLYETACLKKKSPAHAYRKDTNDLNILFSNIQEKNGFIIEFLENSGFNTEEISISPPGILDKEAAGYSSSDSFIFRYSGDSTITVYYPIYEPSKASKPQPYLSKHHTIHDGLHIFPVNNSLLFVIKTF
jgi:hypothetical protein